MSTEGKIECSAKLSQEIDFLVDIEDVTEAINELELPKRWNHIAYMLNEINLEGDLDEEKKVIIENWLNKKLQDINSNKKYLSICQTIAEDGVNSQQFYELLQSYRHAPMTNQNSVLEQFNEIKQWIEIYKNDFINSPLFRENLSNYLNSKLHAGGLYGLTIRNNEFLDGLINAVKLGVENKKFEIPKDENDDLDDLAITGE